MKKNIKHISILFLSLMCVMGMSLNSWALTDSELESIVQKTVNLDATKKLSASDEEAFDNLGYSVAISANFVVLGSPYEDDNGENSGAVYIYNRNTLGVNQWGEVTKLLASDGETGDLFGWSVAINGDNVIVGAINADAGAANSGAAYIFNRNQGGMDNWGEVKILVASDRDLNDFFGNSVSISGTTAIVGAYSNDDFGQDTGAAYIFERDEGGASNWGQVKKVLANDAEAANHFGYSVDIDGNLAAIGARWDNDNGARSGSVYIFGRDVGGPMNWGQVKKLLSSDGGASDYFGYSISLSGNIVLVGAWGDDDIAADSGAAYVFEKDEGGPNNWGQTKKIKATDCSLADRFGISVSLDGFNAIIGAYLDDEIVSNSGSAYLYERNEGGIGNWGETQKILAKDGAQSDAGASDFFGWSVAIHNETAAIGSYQNDPDAITNAGAAYVYFKMGALPPVDFFFTYISKPSKNSPHFDQDTVNPLVLEDEIFPGVPQKKPYDITKFIALGNPADFEKQGIINAEVHMGSYVIRRVKRACIEGSPISELQYCSSDYECGGTGLCQHVPKDQAITNVTVSNSSFGEVTVDLLQPDRLLVPSVKTFDFAPPVPNPDSMTVDHYKCYRVRNSKGSPRFEKTWRFISDQFIDAQINPDHFGDAKLYEIIKPSRFCNPVSENGEEIKDAEAYLMCYQVKFVKKYCLPGSPVNEMKPCKIDLHCGGENLCQRQELHERLTDVFINNQFDQPLQITVKREDELCVPSTLTIEP
jgi:hypothetical protein